MLFRQGGFRSAISKLQAIVILVILVVAAIVGVTYAVSRPETVSIGLATSSNLGTAGTPITFTVVPSAGSVKSVSWNFGDGNTATTSDAATSHTYANGGSYLIEANASVSYSSGLIGYTSTVSNDMALISVKVSNNPSQADSLDGSVPTIGFPTSTNPGAPVFSTGATVSPLGGFLQPPQNTNYSIESYTWNFGNGFTKTVPANSSTSAPSANVTGSYSSSGLYPITLTLTTGTSSGATQQVSTTTTVAVKSTARTFALLSSQAGAVINPGVITLAEVWTGGPQSLDPLVDYEDAGGEVEQGLFQTLTEYNGSQTTSFLPFAAAQLPTVANGGISANGTVFSFTIRAGDTFSNGDPLNAYAVWYSQMRALIFAGGDTGSWVLDQFLVPGVQNGTGITGVNNTYANAIKVLTYSNATNTVAFHFNRPMNPTTVFQILSQAFGNAIMDPKVIEAAGAGWTQANWNSGSYALEDVPTDFNVDLQYNPQYIIGSGPFVIQSFLPGQSIVLAPNPKYQPVPGIPAVKDDVVIEWVSNPNTALLLLQNGQADSAAGIPNSDYPLLQKMQSQGIINIYNFPNTMSLNFWQFNIDTNLANQASYFGPGFNEPANYFADIATRNVWLDSFNYSGYIDNLLGNKQYNATFGVPQQGQIAPGESYYQSPSYYGGIPTQNLAWAKGNFSVSAWKDMKITIPVGYFVLGPQGSYQLAAIEQWASVLSQISGGNITVKAIDWPLSLGSLGVSALPISWTYATPDYPSGADYTTLNYGQGNAEPILLGWELANFTALAPNNTGDFVQIGAKDYPQSVVWEWLQGNLSAGSVATNTTLAGQYYDRADWLGVKLALWVYEDESSGFWYWRTWLGGIQNEEGPMYPGGGFTYLYWLTKP